MNPLQGVRVLEFASSLSGPYMGMVFGDLGASVVKVENPGGGDMTRGWGPRAGGGESAYFLSTNRNKRSMVVDLHTEEGVRLARRLIADADVVVDNFRPGSKLRDVFAYDRVREVNSRAVHVQLSAFGTNGPWSGRPGYDLIAQATGGLMSVTGDPDGKPVRAGFSIADLTTGLFGLIGALAALAERERTGQGRLVTTSLFEAQLALHVNLAMDLFVAGVKPVALGSAHPNLAPYQAFTGRDGDFVVAVATERLWERLCRAIGRIDLLDDPRFADNSRRVQHRADLAELLNGMFVTESVSHWVGRLDRAQIPAAPILSIEQVYSSEHTAALGIVTNTTHPTAGLIDQVASPLSFDDMRARPRSAPPTLGQHTDEILAELGFDASAGAALRRNGIVA
ncbi:CaiB/BaiF CoA transferase family protein [Pseudonocardia sp. CA-142604]|uniref:CaiB/BaiF CoA transferase family protein n=1 Tax=Pseudonocardia sp. CA-142604 TaxID=3240024 RepID=UPI003D917125